MSAILKFIHRLEDSALVLLVLVMIGLSVSQIWLRNVNDSGIYWADNALRVMVLWLAMLGAMIATREHSHIAIDVLSHYLRGVAQKVMAIIASAMTAAVCLAGAWYSWQFVALEMEDSYYAFAKVPAWLCEIIIPIGLFIIGVRFLFRLAQMVLGVPEEEAK
ncbi:TRAP-type C4-dicarboxylate transport system permease small subunit [Sinobacterium caligoides]|uniref:TRAP transporter small permease protein n=1 Tax=Sinobacterium caligoides TaxID=933926 RepID=A0A3N2DNV2_9GAMM|nr:TRAP transporter small permease subunit [Sinobacterium caligoides]ROS01491.1 TRAP-type C4-dicarboxylate transport system permease small subunit [Sinobacterium caligoides]